MNTETLVYRFKSEVFWKRSVLCEDKWKQRLLKTLTKKCIPCILLLYISLCVFRCSNVEDNRKCIEMYAFADKNTLLCAVERKQNTSVTKNIFLPFVGDKDRLFWKRLVWLGPNGQGIFSFFTSIRFLQSGSCHSVISNSFVGSSDRNPPITIFKLTWARLFKTAIKLITD